jgi:hypothetical protein
MAGAWLLVMPQVGETGFDSGAASVAGQRSVDTNVVQLSLLKPASWGPSRHSAGRVYLNCGVSGPVECVLPVFAVRGDFHCQQLQTSMLAAVCANCIVCLDYCADCGQHNHGTSLTAKWRGCFEVMLPGPY